MHVSAVQSAILAGIGLQRKSVDDLEVGVSSVRLCTCVPCSPCKCKGGRGTHDGVWQHELSLPASQIMALFNKTVRKVNQVYRDILSAAIEVRARMQLVSPSPICSA